MRVCESCGADIPRNPNWGRAYYATRRFCNRACAQSNTHLVTEDYEVTPEGCWNWLGHIDRNGYGKAFDSTRPTGRRLDWAHRVAYRNAKGEIPAGHEIDHTCRNTACINPEHLDAVTRAEHVRRTFNRLSKDDIHSDAAKYRALGLTYREIAELTGYAGRESAHQAVAIAIAKGLVDPDSLPVTNRLTDEEREDIQLLCALGIPQTEVAAWYQIDSSHVSRISRGFSSSHKEVGAA